MRWLIESIKIRLSPSKRISKDIATMRWFSTRGMKIIAKLLSNKIYYRYNCCISPNAQIASDVIFPHPTGIVIGEGAVVQSHCIIYQQVTIGKKRKTDDGYPVLGKKCILYAGSSIFGEISIADGVVIGANSIVTKSCEKKNCILIGSPAHEI